MFIRIIFYLLFLIPFNLFGLELIKVITMDDIKDVDYSLLQKNFNDGHNIISQYDTETGNIYVYLPTFSNLSPNKTSHTMDNTIQRKYSVDVFSKTGKYIGRIGKNEGFCEECYKNIEEINVVNKEVQLGGTKLLAFNKNNLKFKYYLDTSFKDSSEHTVILCFNGKCLGKRPEYFDVDNFNSAFVAKVETDTTFSNVKAIKSIEGFMDIKKYKNRIFNNYDIFKKSNLSPSAKSFAMCILTNFVYVNTKFSLQDDNSYYAINSYATDLFYYNKFDKLQNSLSFKDVVNMRDLEIENFIGKSKHYRSVKYFSSLENFFIGKNDICYLYFFASDIIGKSLGNKRILYAYSIKNKKEILNLTPIDFYPVTYDKINNLLIGIKIVKNKVKLLFYKE